MKSLIIAHETTPKPAKSYTDYWDEGASDTYRIGQIWKDKVRKPRGMVLITHIVRRVYADGTDTIRIMGTSTFSDGFVGRDHEWDHRSLAKLFPHLVFDVAPSGLDRDDDDD